MSLFKYVLLSVSGFFSFAVGANVTLHINNQQFDYVDAPSMVEVLSPVAQSADWYWPASKLFRLKTTNLEAERDSLLAQLEQLKVNASDKAKQEITALQYFVRQWQLAERIVIPIDYDRARLESSFNPSFEPGSYLMQLSRRPTTVTFWGALQNSVTLYHKGVTPVAEYLTALTFSEYADRQNVVILQPDGRVQTVGIAAWNNQFSEVMPGATVFVPFSFGIFDAELQQLNERLLALAVNRIK